MTDTLDQAADETTPARKDWTFADLKRTKQLGTVSQPIVLDADWGSEVSAAQDRLTALSAMLRATPNAADDEALMESLEEAKEKLAGLLEGAGDEGDERVVIFKFRPIGGDAYDLILAEHPPTDAQVKRAQAKGYNAQWNNDTFPIAIIAATIIQPRLKESEIYNLWHDDAWTEGDRDLLLKAAFKAATLTFDVQLG